MPPSLPNRDITCRISFGDAVVQMTAQGASWNPDVAHDLVQRTAEAFQHAVTILGAHQVFDGPGDEDEE